jgi:hypothetical protein
MFLPAGEVDLGFVDCPSYRSAMSIVDNHYMLLDMVAIQVINRAC